MPDPADKLNQWHFLQKLRAHPDIVEQAGEETGVELASPSVH